MVPIERLSVKSVLSAFGSHGASKQLSVHPWGREVYPSPYFPVQLSGACSWS